MEKEPISRRRRVRALTGSGPTATAGVTIASGEQVVRVDLETLFRNGRAGEVAPTAVGAGAITGGGVQTPTVMRRGSQSGAPETIALADGTRITFAAADWFRVLEPT